MPPILKILASRTVWMFIAIAVIDILNDIKPLLPPKWQGMATGILTILGIWFRITPSRDFHPEREGKITP